jgi:archaeosine synthase
MSTLREFCQRFSDEVVGLTRLLRNLRVRREIYKKVSCTRGRGVKIKRSLCFYNPKEVYLALTRNGEVKRWLNFISNHYLPEPRQVLLIYPCSAEKPYNSSRSYKRLYETLSKLGNMRGQVHIVTISEPFGLIPEEFYGKKTAWHDWRNAWYDCPGLFKWWCNKYNQPYSKEYLEKCVELLAFYIASFLKKVDSNKCYAKIIAFVRTYSSQLKAREDHTHKRIIEMAAKIANVHIEILPTKEVVSYIVSKNGRLAWDMYGVAHPHAQEYLLNYLKVVLNG